MKINENMEKCLNQLELLVNLKNGISQRDDNECGLISRTVKELKMEIENCEHTLNIVYSKKIPEEHIKRVLQNIIDENPSELNIHLIPKTPRREYNNEDTKNYSL